MNVIAMHSTRPWAARARESVEAAAARWGCDVRVFDFAYAPHPSWARLELAKYLLAYDRAMVLDPDIFISEDCPNVFEHVPRTHVGMAMEIQVPEDQVGPYPWAGALAQWRNILGRRVAIERHLQGGVCIYTPQLHMLAFEQMLGWWNLHGRFSFPPVYEQPLWHEVGERLFSLPVRRLSRLLNRHTRTQHELPQSFITHLTGGNKNERMEVTNWRGDAQSPPAIIAAASASNPSLAPQLMSLLRIGVFHEYAVVMGDQLGPAALMLAEITAGEVHWHTSRSAPLLDIPASFAHAKFRLHIHRGDADPSTLHPHATLIVQPDAFQLITWHTSEPAPTSPDAATRCWRSIWQPDAPLGRVRQAAVRTLLR
ncbi:MAG TPA: hypothetical protein VK157_12260 [Phycisphaerales bacterium]|nr:hypothetical protein [Phycisphaerales bacterium]